MGLRILFRLVLHSRGVILATTAILKTPLNHYISKH